MTSNDLPTEDNELELSCPICFEDYELLDTKRQPKVLLCLHTFCYSCLATTLRYDLTLQCSICRAEHKIASLLDLMDNTAIHQILIEKQEEADRDYAYRVSQEYSSSSSESELDEEEDHTDEEDELDEEGDHTVASCAVEQSTAENAIPNPIALNPAENAMPHPIVLSPAENAIALQLQELFGLVVQAFQAYQLRTNAQREQHQEQQQEHLEEHRQQLQQHTLEMEVREQAIRQQRQQQQQTIGPQQQQTPTAVVLTNESSVIIDRQLQQEVREQTIGLQQQQSAAAVVSNESSVNDRKVFVGGISPCTTHDELKVYFTAFGQVDEVAIKNRFAFVTFAESQAAIKVIGIRDYLNGYSFEVKKYQSRGFKMFVGGLTGLPVADVMTYFKRFGPVMEISSSSEDLSFVTYERERDMLNAIQTPLPEEFGPTLRVKRFNPNYWY